VKVSHYEQKESVKGTEEDQKLGFVELGDYPKIVTINR
jgi:hypothetical protein